MKPILNFIVLFFVLNCYSQNKNCYIFMNNDIKTNTQTKEKSFSFTIRSLDKRFLWDYYSFYIQNKKGFDVEGNLVFYSLEEIRKEVNIDSIEIYDWDALSKFEPYKLHEKFSLENIYLVRRIEIKDYWSGNHKIKHFVYPMRYDGTKKNFVLMDGCKF